MREQVPKETKGGEGADREGKYIIDSSVRIKSCSRCWYPLYYKENKLYCRLCGKFRNAKTSIWIDKDMAIKFVTKEQLTCIVED